MSNNEQELPWYRQFWPWFIAFPPAATVVAGAVTAWLAGAGPALVVDDYGQIGKVTMQRAVRDERAGELGLSGRVGLEAVEPGNEAVSLVGGYERPGISIHGNNLCFRPSVFRPLFATGS